jgi:hypothetical protein
MAGALIAVLLLGVNTATAATDMCTDAAEIEAGQCRLTLSNPS